MPTEIRISDVGDAHRRATLGAHFPEDRVRDRYRKRPVVAEVRRRDDDLEAIEEIETVDAVRELEREESAEAAEQRRARAHAAGATASPGNSTSRTCGCDARNAASACAFAHVRSIRSASVSAPTAIGCACSGRERAAPVAQPLLADLLDAPHRRRLRLVVLGDVGEARPVEEARVRDAAGKRVAVAADVFGQRVDASPAPTDLGRNSAGEVIVLSTT